MDNTHKADFSQAITALIRSYNKPAPDKYAVRAYFDVLKWLDWDRFERLLERVYRDKPKFCPSAPQMANLAKGGTTVARGGVPGGARRRRLEIAALRARISGDAPPATPEGEIIPVRLIAFTEGMKYTEVSEMEESDARRWLDHFERQESEEREALEHGQE